jgi:hypothetical protein
MHQKNYLNNYIFYGATQKPIGYIEHINNEGKHIMTNETKTYAAIATAIRGMKRANETAAKYENDALKQYIVSEGERFAIDWGAFDAAVNTKPTAKTKPLKGVTFRRKSEIEGVVAYCHELFDFIYDDDPATKRKDAIAIACDNGVAYYTARTQYQKWFAANREHYQALANEKVAA